MDYSPGMEIKMRKMAYLSLLLILIGLTVTAQDSNSSPEVTNVVAQQVDQQVEISYDLLDQDGDLVTVAGNFGQSSLAAPASVASEIEFTTEQKHHIAIDQLAAQPERSSAEEMVLGVLQAILPERLPSQTQLLANYPNPFNPETWIPFQLSQDTEVIVTIYDVLGELVRQLELGMVRAGRYVTAGQAAYWDGKTEVGEAVSSGTYFYQLKAGDYTETRKMVILK